jgi:septal ring factor EnvC (AmiA/AmiB activator)
MATAGSAKEGDLERLLKIIERREEEAKKEREEAKRREEEARREREEARGREERQRQEMDRLLRIVSDLQGRLASTPHANDASQQATSGSSLSTSASNASHTPPLQPDFPAKPGCRATSPATTLRHFLRG